MSVTPNDFLKSASELAKLGSDEMTQRNIISRAYYSAFHRSCEFIEPEDSDENVGVHKRYINQLMKGDNGSIERKIGGKIKSMYMRRRDADYLIREDIKSDATALQLNAARDLFSIIGEAEKSHSSDGKKGDEGVGCSTARSQPNRSHPSLKIVK